MYQKNNFVYVHLQKTAGTHIKKLLVDVFGEEDVPSKWHGSLAPEHESKFVFCGVRNPWDFYVSAFHHSKEQVAPPINYFKSIPDLFEKTYANPDTIAGFRIWLTHVLSGSVLDRASMRVPRRLLSKPGRKLLLANKIDMLINKKSAEKIGTMSRWLFAVGVPNYRKMSFSGYAEFERDFDELSLIDTYYRMESLEEDMRGIINDHLSPPTGWEKKFEVWAEKKSNTSQRMKSYEVYYDKELAEMVAEKDRFIIERFNYKF